MKRTISTLLLLLIITIGSSFKSKMRQSHLVQFKNDGVFIAVIDGKMFNTRDDNKYSAELTNKSGDVLLGSGPSSMVKSTCVTNSLVFYGNQYFDESGNIAEERISFDYSFKDGAIGEMTDRKIMVNYNNDKYFNLPEGSSFKITRLQWSADRRYFVMDAEFDCKMRRWGMPAEAQPIVHLKGKLENINVTVPSWIVIKNPAQTASGQ